MAKNSKPINPTTPSVEDVVSFIKDNQAHKKVIAGDPKTSLGEKEIYTVPKELKEDVLKTLGEVPLAPVTEEVKSDSRVEVPVNPKVVNNDTNSLSKQFMDLSKVVITDDDKLKFEKSIISDEPLVLDIEYRKLTISFKTKTVKEQEYFNKYIQHYVLNSTERGEERETYDNLMIQILKYTFISSLTQFERPTFNSYEDYVKFIEDNIEIVNGYGDIKYITYINALRIFEQKIKLLTEYFVNLDF